MCRVCDALRKQLKKPEPIAYLGDVCVRVELDGLVPGVVARHVAFAAVDTHLRVDESDHMLPLNK